MIYINTTGKQNQVWLPKPYDIVINDCPEAEDAWNSGHTSGYTDGYGDGWDSGYTSGYTDGINSCSGGSCEGIWEEGYESGYTDGSASSGAGYDSGYTDGFGDGYDSGYTDGAASVDCSDYYNSGYTDGHSSGVTDGENAQKAKLVATSVTENGVYSRVDGFSLIEVTVPTTATTDRDLIANLQGDYFLIPDGTAELRPYAFYETCFSSITIPSSVTYIGNSAFAYNECLTSITIPNTVTGGDFTGVFYHNDNLQSVVLSSGMTSLGRNCFAYCGSLTDITIPNSVSYIGNAAFGYCSGLTAMTFEGLVPPTLEDSGSTQIRGSLGSTAYTFPIYVPCAVVEDYKTAFGTAYAPRITCNSGQTMPTALTLNVDSAITDNGQATVTIEPTGGQGDITFSSSDNTIATIDQNGNITVITSGTVIICAYDSRSGLEDCKTITVSKSVGPESGVVQTIYLRNEEATSGKTMLLLNGASNLAKAELLDGTVIPLPSITGEALYYNLPTSGLNGVKYTLTSYTLNFTFGGCHHLISVVIPSGVTVLSNRLLQRCSRLSAVTIPEGVINIDTECFACQSDMPNQLTSITIPSTVTRIGRNCFEYNTNLQSIVFKGTTPPTIESNALRPAGRCVYYVPSSAVNAYKSAWPSLAADIQANPNE